ncbi:Phosphatidylinositol 4,5-bisphosphate 3-kinase [Actinidia chinensis var. chinensis]|uniref:Phosphatidylinositol 4,5-bisphosphate 3-kinase n=1 Tax=Actinidia chinensis var. chinensis TaxID=1590841 RepID=A0A2R6QHJ0_ACTCC|nr:Phosphatidylinositol 4,5-bisphosphate 3-kinase [Actinidia chinensis var. chinensis]
MIYQDGVWFPSSPIMKEVVARYHITFMQVFVNFVQIMLTMDTLMCQMKLAFSASDLLHVYTVVRPKREPCTPFLKGNHYLHLKNLCQPQTRLVTDNLDKDMFLNEFVWVSGKREFQAKDDGLWLFLRYNCCLPNNFSELLRCRSED